MVLTTDLTNSFWTKDGWNCGIQLNERNHEIVQFQMKNGRQCTSVANIFVKPDTCQCFARAVDLIWGSDFCLHSLLARHVYAVPTSRCHQTAFDVRLPQPSLPYMWMFVLACNNASFPGVFIAALWCLIPVHMRCRLLFHIIWLPFMVLIHFSSCFLPCGLSVYSVENAQLDRLRQ